MSPKKQEPTNREAFPRSSVGHITATPLLGQICYVFDAETPKPPTYPFKSFNFQRARRQKFRNHQILGASCNRAFNYHAVIFVTAFRRVRFAFPRLVRFGKAVFRSVRKKLQEENVASLSFSCRIPVFIGCNGGKIGVCVKPMGPFLATVGPIPGKSSPRIRGFA